jgi:hypothetical protein
METLKLLGSIYLFAYLFSIPGMWKTFKKIGLNPWLSPWPFVNYIMLMRYFKMHFILMILFLIPGPSLLVFAFVNYKLAQSFSFGVLFAIGLTFWFTCPIFITILGFGKYEFIGSEGLV